MCARARWVLMRVVARARVHLLRGHLARHVMADGESVHGKDACHHRGGQPQNQQAPWRLKRATNLRARAVVGGHGPHSMSRLSWDVGGRTPRRAGTWSARRGGCGQARSDVTYACSSPPCNDRGTTCSSDTGTGPAIGRPLSGPQATTDALSNHAVDACDPTHNVRCGIPAPRITRRLP